MAMYGLIQEVTMSSTLQGKIKMISSFSQKLKIFFSARLEIFVDDFDTFYRYRIGPFEVESALISHPAVLESAAVASPDQSRGMVVKAFVVISESVKNELKTEDDILSLQKEIQEHCKKVTAPYKYPRKIEFVETLPKTVSGKIQRVKLRQLEQERYDNSN